MDESGGGPARDDPKAVPGVRDDRIGGERVYRGRVFDVDLDRVRFPDGSIGELEIIRHPGASAVLPLYRTGEWPGGDGPAVVLLRQYRYAAAGRLWEVPAGKLDDGETPEACARRELEEEAGVRAEEVRPLIPILTTPGFTDEEIHLFVALGLRPGTARHEESEFIERREIPLARALRMVRDGEIRDAKTVCALLYGASFDPAVGSGM